MKSEKIRQAIGEIDNELIESAYQKRTIKRSSRKWVSGSVAAALFLLILAGGIGIPRMIRQSEPSQEAPSVSQAWNESEAESGQNATQPGTEKATQGSGQTGYIEIAQGTADAASRAEPEMRIIWADGNDAAGNEGFGHWGSSDEVSMRLIQVLETAEEGDVIAILARPSFDGSFEFEGETLAGYYAAMSAEKNLPELLSQLLKDGESLKYGTALYETGTPAGEKWSRELYEERVAFYGEAVLTKYLVNGEFLEEQLKKDIAEAENRKEAEAAYEKAQAAWLAALAASVEGALPSEVIPKESAILVYLTRTGFSALTAGETENWSFDLAPRGEDEAFGADE